MQLAPDQAVLEARAGAGHHRRRQAVLLQDRNVARLRQIHAGEAERGEDLAALLDRETEVAPDLRHDALLQLALTDAGLERARGPCSEQRRRREDRQNLPALHFSFPDQHVHRFTPLTSALAAGPPRLPGSSVQQSESSAKRLRRPRIAALMSRPRLIENTHNENTFPACLHGLGLSRS